MMLGVMFFVFSIRKGEGDMCGFLGFRRVGGGIVLC